MLMMNMLKTVHILPRLKATSKKQVLQELSNLVSSSLGMDETSIFNVVWERERLGTTGVGKGVAIPHGKVPKMDKILGFFARLEKPVDFSSIDDQPVDLVFMLLTPEGAGADHLKALAQVSRLLRDTQRCEKIRGAENADSIYALLIDNELQETAYAA